MELQYSGFCQLKGKFYLSFHVRYIKKSHLDSSFGDTAFLPKLQPNFTKNAFFFFLKHWIRLEIFPDVLVHRLKMIVDPADSSYMPSLVVVSGN